MGTLDGIRVLDLGHYIAGPLAAHLLAEHGADVIRVDRPAALEHAYDAYLHSLKRRITLDLKDADDLHIVRGLVARADVLIENFRPGVLERYGLGPDQVRVENPALVYASLPGFGRADPRAAVPGWEGVIDAATGNCRVRFGEAPDGWDMSRPTYPSLPIASNFAAILASTAIVASLHRREATGRGAHVEVPLFDATFEHIGHAAAYPLSGSFRAEGPITENLGSGTFESADGRWVTFNPIGATMRFVTWLLNAAGKQSWVAEGLSRPKSFESDPGLGSLLHSRLTELFLTRTAQEWDDLGRQIGVPLCMVRSAGEWVHSDHARKSHQVVTIRDSKIGDTWLAGSPITLSSSPAVSPQPRHARDADRATVIADAFGSKNHPSKSLGDDIGGPTSAFEGLRVIDLTQILAGPSAGRILAEFGADVIKINAPQRPVFAHGVVNRGKRSILIDLQRSEGQDLVWRLIENADVVIQNFPQGIAERMGLGFSHVHARRPDIVYLSVSCYGYGGPWAGGRGYEVQGQAATGIMERAGRSAKPAIFGPFNPLDYGTGAMAALGATLALFHRARTGEGQHVSTSLTQVGTFHEATLLVSLPAENPTELAGREALGPGALQRFYQANDGWLFIGADRDQAGAVVDALGIPRGRSVDSAPNGSLALALESAIRGRLVAELVLELRALGVGAHEIVPLPDLLQEPYVVATGLSFRQHFDEVGEVIMPGPAVVIDGKRIPARQPVSDAGADAALVLGQLGGPDNLADLDALWIVQNSALPHTWL